MQRSKLHIEKSINQNVCPALFKCVSNSRYGIPCCTIVTRELKGTRFLSSLLLLILASCTKVNVECKNPEDTY